MKDKKRSFWVILNDTLIELSPFFAIALLFIYSIGFYFLFERKIIFVFGLFVAYCLYLKEVKKSERTI